MPLTVLEILDRNWDICRAVRAWLETRHPDETSFDVLYPDLVNDGRASWAFYFLKGIEADYPPETTVLLLDSLAPTFAAILKRIIDLPTVGGGGSLRELLVDKFTDESLVDAYLSCKDAADVGQVNSRTFYRNYSVGLALYKYSLSPTWGLHDLLYELEDSPTFSYDYVKFVKILHELLPTPPDGLFDEIIRRSTTPDERRSDLSMGNFYE